MLELPLRVTYTTYKNCFCYLSAVHRNQLSQGNTIQITRQNSQTIYLSIGGLLPNLAEDVLGLNPLYANALELQENESVVLIKCAKPSTARSVSVSPVNQSDYDILSAVASLVENALLQQIQVVGTRQKFIIWISNFSTIMVSIDDVKPASPATLDVLTELHVNYPTNNLVKTKEESGDSNKNVDCNIFEKYLERNNENAIYTLFPIEPKNAAVFPDSTYFDAYCSSTAFEIPKVLKIKQLFCPAATATEEKEIHVHCQKLETKQFKNLKIYAANPLFINKYIFDNYFGAKGMKVKLIDPGDNSASCLKIFMPYINLEHAKKQFMTCIENKIIARELLLCPNVIFELEKGILCRLEMEGSFCLLNKDSIKSIKLEVNYDKNLLKKDEAKNPKHCSLFWKNGTVENILQEVIENLETNFKHQEMDNILIVGKSGAGKSALVQKIAEELQSSLNIHVEFLNCKKVKGKSVESLAKLLSPIVTNLIYFQPSVLVIDDLNVICEKVPEGDAPTPQGLYFNAISEMLAAIIDEEFVKNNISIVATSTALDLNAKIVAVRGKHRFKSVVQMKELNQDERKSCLHYLLSNKSNLQDINLDYFVIKTEGYLMKDIVDFTDRALYESLKEENSFITNDNCEVALSYVNEMCLQDVKLHSPGDRCFDDIGGLKDVKDILIESLLWPLQYSHLFSSAPLRLQSGLLLYGPPGTGKTILAAAAAKQCGVKLISVKGPELLSKYIGASEQAVREIFEKAQKAKPCILFFDEFDSLAPRRGHDNTGVTDRIVNQLLTQLDGIETLEGVCVLAATSRPDLLDPALLRPGRLDKQIHCPLPDKAARLEILQILTKKFILHNVNLENVAEKTEGFSGADLQSVVSSAQILAFENLKNEDLNLKKLEISECHFNNALTTARPLSTNERKKYETMYANFSNRTEVQDYQTGKIKLKATLA